MRASPGAILRTCPRRVHSERKRSDYGPVQAGQAGRRLRSAAASEERMTSQIADSLMEVLEPRGVIVVVEAEHLCMAMRGVRKPGSKTVTSAVRGCFRSSDGTRAEAMSLLMARR